MKRTSPKGAMDMNYDGKKRRIEMKQQEVAKQEDRRKTEQSMTFANLTAQPKRKAAS